MNSLSLEYPVLCFSQNLVRVKNSLEDLTTCSKTALRNGYFSNLEVVDSRGHIVRVHGARKLSGVGMFWGYNIFLNQRIKVELFFEAQPVQIALANVKGKVLKSFNKWHGWASRDDFEELVANVKAAKSVPEIVALVSDPKR